MDAVTEFEGERDRLLAVAYRMLGSRPEAEDAVQEAWLRYQAADRAAIEELPAWLTTVTARICLDVLRSARTRREAYVGPWLPEPLVSRLPGPGGLAGFAGDPADRAARTDEVSFALLVVMERLTPEQRVAFVLHDVFAVPFEEIAQILGTTGAAARQLASRARRAVTAEGAPQHRADRAEQRRVLAAFVVAVEAGDLNGLLAVLAPDAVMIGDGGGVVSAARHPVVGAARVARFVAGIFRKAVKEATTILVEPVLINGDLGLLTEATHPDGRAMRFTMAFAVADGRITGIFDQLNPAKLTAVPTPAPERALPR
ncbi:RNA polymerase sigma factor SigJ [Micromonospora sp. NPDC049679]|uniref:RNA polymerase sigma factor SigJ n=1 Tax=Micromonospora sp. NPDC049679 TaxID=3155920 RepID=UPI0033FC8855